VGTVDRSKLIQSAAQFVIALIFGGPVAGARAAAEGFAAVMVPIVGESKKSAFDRVLKEVGDGLSQVAKGEGVSPDQIEPAVSAFQDVFRNANLKPEDLVEFKDDAGRAAEVTLRRVKPQLGRDCTASLCGRLVREFFARFLRNPEVLQALELPYRSAVMRRLEDVRLQFDLLRAAAVHVLLYDPALEWRGGGPASLLHPDYQIVRFTGRDDILSEIDGWCDEVRPVAVRLYTGQGGSGKTRLFIEACRRIWQRDRWRTGFLHPEAGQAPAAAFDALLEGQDPVFIVVDEAETRPNELSALLRRIAQRPAPRVRVIMLSRGAGRWWQSLQGQGDHVGELLQQNAECIALPPLAPTPDMRRQIFDAAAEDFAVRLERAPARIAAPDLKAPEFETVLFVHMAALIAVLEGKTVEVDRLAQAVLNRERGFWEKRGQQAGLSELVAGEGLEQAVAFLTVLGGAADGKRAETLLARVPRLRGQTPAALRGLANLLHDLYGGRQWIESLRPDLVGEELLSRRLDEDGQTLSAAAWEAAEGDTPLTRFFPVAKLRVWVMVNRIAMRKPEPEREIWLRTVAPQLADEHLVDNLFPWFRLLIPRRPES
jgi:hypothetical protein